MSTGQNIKHYREKKNLTQYELAKILTVTPQAISKWENDKTEPNISALLQLANLLDVSIDQLLGNNSKIKSIKQSDSDYLKAKKSHDLTQLLQTSKIRWQKDSKNLNKLYDYASASLDYALQFDQANEQRYQLIEEALDNLDRIINIAEDSILRKSAINLYSQIIAKFAFFDIYINNLIKNYEPINTSVNPMFYSQIKILHHLEQLVIILMQNTDIESFIAAEKTIYTFFPDKNYLHFDYYLYQIKCAKSLCYINKSEFEKAIYELSQAKSHMINYEFALSNESVVYTSPFFNLIKESTTKWQPSLKMKFYGIKGSPDSEPLHNNDDFLKLFIEN